MLAKRILLVEGPDDEHVLKGICGVRNVGEIDEIKPQKGVESLLKNFPNYLRASELEALGVVIDADIDLAGRWNSVKHQLIRAGYPNVPESPVPVGTILPAPPGALLPRVGIWIMPDNQTSGILEDFLRFLVPANSDLFLHVQSSVAGIPPAERRFTKLAEPKAIIHTWLAWQETPGRALGTAITTRFLDANVAQVNPLVTWLQQLFFP